MASENLKLYVVLSSNADDGLWTRYQANDVKWVRQYITDRLPPEQARFLQESLQVTGLPSNGASENLKTRRERKARLDELVVALAVDSDAARIVEDVFSFVRSEKPDRTFTGAGADLPIGGAEHWCPGSASGSIFSNRTAAERLMGVPAFRTESGLHGANVNVVIIDQGLDRERLGDSYAGGWEAGGKFPGEPQRGPDNPHGGHGMMVARNVLSIAPEARLFDLPMLPPRIGNIREYFLSTADAAYRGMLQGIRDHKNSGRFPGAWVLVNAWSVFDRRSENPRGDYTDNSSHPFHGLVAQADASGMDVVFAAGNCGQFCPSGKCGPNDRGPGNSILGANSYDCVLTVGAVRSDALWLGYSSQGPGQPNLATEKPDLCAPSQFCEDSDAYTTNTGTSASAALAAGVIAALRSGQYSRQASPHELRKVFKGTAAARNPGECEHRFGFGILNAAEAYRELAGPNI
jgi:subtilisin family serine protease